MGLLKGFAFDRVKDAEVREGIVGLFNLVEELQQRLQQVEAENERAHRQLEFDTGDN